jgi:hypothetical protein
MDRHLKKIHLKELYNLEEISSRVYDVCNKAKIITLSDLKVFYTKNKSFRQLPGCGAKTNNELKSIYNRYSTPGIKYYNKSPTPQSPLSDFYIDVLIKKKFSRLLGIRSQRALLIYFDNRFPSPNKLREEFIVRQFDPIKLRNIGEKTATEIQGFIDEIIPIL